MTQQLPKAISRQVVLDAIESLGLPINGVRKVELGRDEVVIEWIAKDGDNIEMPFTVSTTKIPIQEGDYRRKRRPHVPSSESRVQGGEQA